MIKLLLIIAITINLFARLNPFEPVFDKNNTKKSDTEVLKPIKVAKKIHTADDGDRTVKIMPISTVTKKPKQIVMIKEKIIEKIVPQKLTKKELEKQCKVIKKVTPIIVKPKKLVKKVKKKFIPKTYKVLPFLTIISNKNNLIIKTRNKYKLIRYYDEANERKFVFDFKGKVLNYTKRKNLFAPYFKSYVVGNHAEDNFFRVVIKVKKATNRYKVSMKNNIATIYYK